jgi:MFS family permease
MAGACLAATGGFASIRGVRHTARMDAARIFDTDVPARLDRLPWCRFHTLVIVALGITWILDGLEVTVTGAVSGALQSSPRLHLNDAEVGLAASAYLAGAVLGALLFGWLTDRLGRKRLFNVTLGLYLVATALTALSPDFASFALFRFLTGAGIGGEYTAINSAIQELIPARYRGHTDLVVNGSFWIGATLGALGAVVLLAPGRLPPDLGWRAAFGTGAVLGLGILWLRRFLPESPRWLMVHGRVAEAESVVAAIECTLAQRLPATALPRVRLYLRSRARSWSDVARSLVRLHPRRATLGVVLMAAQAFFYNAIFFTYALVLGHFFGVASDRVGLYILPFAIGNFLGPLLLGRWFDTLGRRPMIAGTYAVSGLLLLVTAWLFVAGMLDATTQTVAWSIVFFFASAAASSAYLTVSESFPLEVRALAIALFYALGTALGGVAAPWVFGLLVGTGERAAIGWGYVLGAVLMLVAAGVELKLGFAAERRSLEDVATPLSVA